MLEDARHRDKTGCLCLTRRNYVPCLKSVCSSNTDHHRMGRAGGGNNACILVDFKAVQGCKLDLLLEMPRCGRGIDSSGCQLEMGICLSAKPDLLLLTLPTCPKTFMGIPWPRRDVSPLAGQEVSPLAAWGAEELLILWWTFWEVCPSTRARGVLSREMCRHGIAPRPPLIPHPTGHRDQVGGYLTPKTPSCQLKV